MMMITAKEAREKSESINYSKRFREETKKCEEKINSAIEEGMTLAIVEKHISDRTKSYLESLGYKVEILFDQTYIKW